jgi:hypothetical protein
MIPRAALFVLILHFALSSLAQSPSVPALQSGARSVPQVLEPHAKATLEKDSIRVTLPLSAALRSEERVVVWLASPKDRRSSQTAATAGVNGHAASAVLPWPLDAHGVHVDEIGWYRIGYRVEVNGVERSHGVLSVGAITANLMSLRLAYPKMIEQGHALSARVVAVNPVTGKALPHVDIKATLSGDEGSSKKNALTQNAITGRNGEAILTFAPLGEPGEQLDLTVEGALKGEAGAIVRDSVDGEAQVNNRGRLLVEIDKPLHKPGETVHLRTLVFTNNGRAAAGEPVTVTVSDPDNKTLAKTALKTNRFGIAAYDWKTSEQLSTGDYDVDFALDNDNGGQSEMTQQVRIQRYDLPEFSLTATPDRPFYLPGDQPHVKIHAGYLFGKPVAAGSVRLMRADDAEWNPKTGRYDEPDDVEDKSQIDANGDSTLTLKVADEFDDLKNDTWRRYRDVKYRAMVTDASTGRTEPRNFVVRLSREPVHIYLNAIGTSNREGEYLLSTVFADGAPAPCKVTLDWMNAQLQPARAASVKTNRYGLAKVTLHYPPGPAGKDDYRPSVRVTARDAEGRISHFDDQLWSGMNHDLWLSLEHSILRPGEPIEGTVHARPGTGIDMDVLSETGVLEHWRVHMSGSEQSFIIPTNPAFHGLITLRAYNLRDQARESRWYGERDGAARSVLFPEDHSLNVAVKGLAATYSPGAKVNAELSMRSADKGATAGVFGVSVFDIAVEQRAETEAEANDRWFGRGWWWLDNTSVGDVTRESLNRTDTSHPIDADLDLAAEAVLLNSADEPLSIESNDDSTEREEYQKQMENAVWPLGNAILAALPLDLPATLEDVMTFAATAKLDSLLLDPWNVPYKVETSQGWHSDIVSLLSAGPDKQFGTADDFTLSLVERNIYAVPGAKLNALLEKTAQAGKPLPATVSALKTLAREAGLDLNSADQRTLDRNGKPYTYAIDVVRRSYFVEVQAQNNETVWQSRGIDYFGPTETRLNAAIAQWTATAHTFPENESDARKAFAEGGIDFSSLHDPIGRPFALRTKRELSYARIDKVKAGASLQGGTEKVTLVAQVIQICRTDENGKSYGDPDEIARFTHTVSQQSGSDLKPVIVDLGLFQGNTGAIGGTVTDMTGAVIPGAAIRVESTAGDATASATSKDDGSYIVQDLAPGFYKIQVSSRGFQSFMLTDVHVSSSALTRVDVKLTIGAATETVEVTADASVATTTDMAVVSAALPGQGKKVGGPNGSATITEQNMTPRLRHVFEETAYWAPSLETSDSGRAPLSFSLPDSLTTWKLHAVGSTIDGRLTEIDQTFKTFQPFIVDLDSPQILTVGDEITLPVNLRNYTAHAITLPVTVKPAGWFSLSTPANTQATIQPNKSTPVRVGLHAASAADAGPLRVTAANAHDGDAIEKTVRVHPDGEPQTLTVSTLLHGSDANTIHLDLPSNAIAGSVHAELVLYPNLGANIAHAMKAVLERPYGCAEQTISTAYASLLYLELMKAANIESPERDKAQAFLQLGYERLQSYYIPTGGLTYWGGSDTNGDAALTAYSIEFFSEAESFVAVDHARIIGAIQWLLSQQTADGVWKPRYGAVSARDTLYIASVLQAALQSRDFTASADLQIRMKKAVAKATAYAATSVLALHDPWSNAVRLLLATQTGDSAALARAHQELISNADRGKDGAHWDFDGYSPFYGWGAAGKLETTALVLAALQKDAQSDDDPLERDALLYLLQARDRYGVWMSGQATMRVLKALLPIAVRQLQSPASSSFKLTVNGLPLGREQANALKIDNQILDAPRTIDLSSMIHAGANILEFASPSDSTFANAQITASLYIPWPQDASGKTEITVPGKNFGFDFGYTCDAANARVGQPIDCTVNARRFGSESYGMMLAEVGLPPGSDVDRASLGKLLDSWQISRYELQPDRIVFYLWSWNAAGDKFRFRFTPRYPIRAKAAPANLIDYYNPGLSADIAPQTFVVTQ